MTLHTNLTAEALRSAFVDAMSRVAATVSIVTTDGQDGVFGATVTAMSSVAVDGASPKLLICLNRSGRLGSQINRNGAFCVNVLGEDQSELSDIFAGRHGLSDRERFLAAPWTRMANGSPGLQNAVSRLACRVAASLAVDTHSVIFGAVEEVGFSKSTLPLLYHGRDYARVGCRLKGPLSDAPANNDSELGKPATTSGSFNPART